MCQYNECMNAIGGPCALIDSVLDYEPKSGRTSTASADRLIAFVREHRRPTAPLT